MQTDAVSLVYCDRVGVQIPCKIGMLSLSAPQFLQSQGRSELQIVEKKLHV